MKLDKWNKQTLEVKQIILDLAISFGHAHYSSLDEIDYKFWEDVQPEDIALALAEGLAKKTKEVHELHISLAQCESPSSSVIGINKHFTKTSINENNSILKNHAIDFVNHIRNREEDVRNGGSSLYRVFENESTEELYNVFTRKPSKNFTKEALAELLNGRQHRDEISKEEVFLAKENGLVIVTIDDHNLIELTGLFNDVFMGSVNINKQGEVKPCEDYCSHFIKAMENSNKITRKLSSLIETDIKDVVTFDVFEGKELRYRGLVFDVESLK